jgi:MoaA/NifB/PqqE/SkfB family radical SAM enzyme
VSKSKFMSAAEEMKDKLGPSLCLAKWQQVSLHLPTGLNNSCYHPPLHEIDAQVIEFNPSALHNTQQKKEKRKKMLAGERPKECNYCWTMEDAGHLSDRHYRSGEPWAAEHYDTIVNQPWDADVTPSYVEVNFSHGCNLACSYCSPQFSSTWGKDTDRWGAYPTAKPHNAPEHFEGRRKPIPVREHNPYVEAFWRWWPDLYPKLKHFRMTGGEPLMDKNTHRVFDYILAFPKPDLHVDVTSNFSVEEGLFAAYLDKVKELCTGERIEHFMQYVSLDTGIAEHAEYIRDGLEYQRLMAYVHRYLTAVPGRNSLTYIITMNNLSILGLQRLLEHILDLRRLYNTDYQRIWFDTPILRTPSWQSLQILPESYVRILENIVKWMELNKLEEDSDRFDGFKDYEIQRLKRDIDWMRAGRKLTKDYVEKTRADFYRFFHEYDQRRGLSFDNTFPQMREFYQECKWHAEQ